MKKTTFIKLLSLMLCAMMLVSVFAACDDPAVGDTTQAPANNETDPVVNETTEAPAEETTEAPAEETTETPAEETTETPVEETTETPAEETTETPGAECDGDHSVEYDEEGHWRDACEEHGVPAVAKVAHNFNYEDDDIYCCRICKFEPDCYGEHEMDADENGHFIPDCEYCGYVGDPDAAGEHVYVWTEDVDYLCEVCYYMPECYGEHEYEANDNGHREAACEYCGAEAKATYEPHDIIEGFEEQGGDLVYTYICSVCDYVVSTRTISSNINKYIGGVDLLVGAASNGKATLVDGNYHVESNGSYTEHIWLREKYVGGGGGSQMPENLNVGMAKYMIVKAKSDAETAKTGAFYFAMSTTGRNSPEHTSESGRGAVTASATMKFVRRDTWTTFVVDLAVLGNRYVVDATAGEYIIDSMWFNLSQNVAGNYVDIEYIAFVDDWTEAASIIEEDIVMFVAADKSQSPLKPDGTAADAAAVEEFLKPDESAPEEPKPEEPDPDETPTEPVELVLLEQTKFTGEELYNFGGSHYQLNASLNDGIFHLSGQDKIGQELFIRSALDSVKACPQYDGIDVGKSNWVVVKVKGNASSFEMGFSTIEVNRWATVADKEAGKQTSYGTNYWSRAAMNVTEDWTVFVFDIADLISHYKLTDDKYIIDTWIIQFTTFASNEYVDIEYIAFAEDWAGIDAVVDEATVMHVTKLDGTATLVKTDGTPA